jgi:hypothetical protein
MEVVPALAAEYLGACSEAGDSIACLKYMLTGASLCCCCRVINSAVAYEWRRLIDGAFFFEGFLRAWLTPALHYLMYSMR